MISFNPISEYGFLPTEYLSSVSKEERAEILAMPQDKMEETIKAADTVKQQVFLQELLIASCPGKKLGQINLAVIAAEIYIKILITTQKQFYKNIQNTNDLTYCQIFKNALLANSVYHEAEPDPKLTAQEMKKEKTIAEELEKFLKSILG